MKLTVTVHPNSSHTRVETGTDGGLTIYLKEPATENKANRALISAIAAHFGVRKSAVLLLRGEKSKHKLIELLTRK